jgi:UDP-glucose 4-epimerase
MANCLVTGGAGFIGSNLARDLLKKGYTVRVLDDFSTGKKSNLEDMVGDIEIIEGDIRDEAAARRAVKQTDYVFHQAALPSVQRSVVDPAATNEVNVRGMLNMLIAARDAGVQRFVFASSSSVYGESEVLPKEESFTPAPLSPYAATKLMGENYCQIFHRLYGFETVALRYFNVFGPRQTPDSDYAAVIPKFIAALLSREKPVIYGDGEQSRDFTYVTNVTEANLQAALSPRSGGQILNIACGNRMTLNELHRKLSDILDIRIEPAYTDPRAGDIRHSYAAVERAEQTIGYRTLVDIAAGLEKTVNWFRKSRKM